MCGIIAALLSNGPVSPELYEGLSILQHRGQDAAGIITNGAKGRLYQCKGNGMVRDVFEENQLAQLIGSQGVGHVRYPTAGTSCMSEAQPFYVNSPYGLVLAHNGNLTNAKELLHYLDYEVHRHINTDSDSELLLNIFADALQETGKVRVNEEDVFKAIDALFQKCIGGYACVAMIPGFGIIGFRDPNGIRPIVFGRRKNGDKYDYMFASESVVLDCLGYGDIKDLSPGQAIMVTKEKVSYFQTKQQTSYCPCIFEYVYFARPDSIMNGISVYKSRLAMGTSLAQKIKQNPQWQEIDVVIPVPETSRVAALQLANELNIPYREGFIKNRYIGRTFIMPGQQLRMKSVRRKLNPMPMEFQDKIVLLVDDSIVRGTTSKEIIQMARESGAKKVYFASCAPPIRYPNVYGIDMPTCRELVAYHRTEEEVAEAIGCDGVIYQDLNDLVECCRKWNPELKEFDVSVFNGEYKTGLSPSYLEQLEQERPFNEVMVTSPIRENGEVKMDTSTIGLYNTYYKRS